MTRRSFDHPIAEMMTALKYDPETGKIIWIKTGIEAGYEIPPRFGSLQIYRAFQYRGLSYLAHRFVFASIHGYWPHYVDHIDGNAQNNAPGNLREVTAKENSRNRPITRHSKTGVLGVTWEPKLKVWRSGIRDAGKTVPLAYTLDFFEAVCRRKSAEISLGYHINHGRPMNKPTESGASE